MKTNQNNILTSAEAIPASRRKFLGTMATAVGLSGLQPLMAGTLPEERFNASLNDADEWFKKVKGSHRIVYDAPEPHHGFPVIWAWAYYLTNNQTGTTDDDMTAVVVLRHNAIPFAMNDELWAKYKLGDTFGVNDNSTQMSAMRNPYYQPKEGDFPMPQIQGIKDMQDRGAMFCVCDLAIQVYSSGVAQAMELDPETVKNEWISGLLPGIQLVPSGVWALGRAQEKGCGYIYAGG